MALYLARRLFFNNQIINNLLILNIFDLTTVLLFWINRKFFLIYLFLCIVYTLLSRNTPSFKSIWDLFFCLRPIQYGLWTSIYKIILFLNQIVILLFLIWKQLYAFHLIYSLFSLWWNWIVFGICPLNQIFGFWNLKLLLIVMRRHWYLYLFGGWSILF